jgi:hypothetical protein
MTEPSLLDERLAEIDERLRTLQSGLQPVADAPSDEPVPESAAGLESTPGTGPESASAAGPDETDETDETDDRSTGVLAAVAQRLQEPPLPRPTPLRAASAPPPPPPVAPPAPPAAPTTPVSDATSPSERLVSQLRELGEAHERLLALHRDLLYQYAEVLEQRAAQATTVSVTAGPFADGDAVRMFESELRGLPGVSATTTREYLAGDRVAIDVRLTDR